MKFVERKPKQDNAPKKNPNQTLLLNCSLSGTKLGYVTDTSPTYR
jgi:hypothetical protein